MNKFTIILIIFPAFLFGQNQIDRSRYNTIYYESFGDLIQIDELTDINAEYPW